MINFTNKKITVIGGGNIATRKVTSFLDSQANISVISPSLTNELAQHASDGSITWVKERFQPSHLTDAFFVIAATNDSRVNEAVIQHTQANQLTLNVSTPRQGNTITPAKITKQNIQIAISTNGASPILAKQVRDKIEQACQELPDISLAHIAAQRKEIIAREEDQQTKHQKIQALTDSIKP